MQWQQRIAPVVEEKALPSEEELFRRRMEHEIAVLEAGERAEHSTEAQELFTHLFGRNDALDALMADAVKQWDDVLLSQKSELNNG